ncbi:unnamed protein product [Schistosoma margrebowiei]|uniref:Uncharacterized protein n=1 Tax=Schistosoma margrebowiei TaxID=48269 RepID=A0A183M1S8_9TREM|nr:unnamed protein product [Schistosoma margrebowiei]
MLAGDRELVHTPFVPAEYWSPCAPLVWNPVKAPDIRFSSSHFKQHPRHEKAHHAIGTFNFLNSERRYVAAAVIPPRRLDVYDEADNKAAHLLLDRESQQSDEIPLLSPTSTKLLKSSDFKGDIIVSRSPLISCNTPSSTSLPSGSEEKT